MNQTKYLIIGNSAGAIGAVEAIREVDREGSLTIVSDEPYHVYSRPMISEFLSKSHTFEKMWYRPAGFYDNKNVRPLLGNKVKSLDPASHRADLENGEVISWDKLLIATGGVPISPPIKGKDRKGVFTFTTLDDAKAIDGYLGAVKKAVVIGGGLIGMSVTEALTKRGVSVTVVEMKDRILNVMLDEQASAMAADALKKAGVSIITNHTVAEIGGDPSEKSPVGSAVLDDGARIDCQLVVIAIGVSPRVELAAGAAIKVNRGIVVDRHMATSAPDVYACGDVAEAYDFIYCQDRLTPIWPNAYVGGRVAGYNMACVDTDYLGGTALNSLKYFGVDIASAGMVAGTGDGYEAVSRQQGDTYRKAVLKNNVVVGMILVNKIEKAGLIFSLMKDQINVADFKSSLLDDDFGLAFLPQEIRRQRFEKSAARPAVKA